MSILARLYLGSEPTRVTVQDEQLIVVLANDHQIELPLSLVSQLAAQHSLPEEAEILILHYSLQIDHLQVTDNALNVYLTDGRLLSCPLAWFPRLMHGTASERNTYELSGDNTVMHWPALDGINHKCRIISAACVNCSKQAPPPQKQINKGVNHNAKTRNPLYRPMGRSAHRHTRPEAERVGL